MSTTPDATEPVQVLVAIIKPFRLSPVLAAIRDDATMVHYTEVRGYGRQKGNLDAYHEASLSTEFIPKVRIEFRVPSSRVGAVVERVTEVARTGRIGDGKIFVFPVDNPA